MGFAKISCLCRWLLPCPASLPWAVLFTHWECASTVKQWNCCCFSCLVLIPPAVQCVWGLQCLWLSRWQQWTDLVCAIFRLRCNSQFSSSCFMEKCCQAFLSFDSALSSCSQVRGRLYETVPERALSSKQLLGCAALPAELRYSHCGTWGSLNTQNAFIFCRTKCPSLSGCPFLA